MDQTWQKMNRIKMKTMQMQPLCSNRLCETQFRVSSQQIDEGDLIAVVLHEVPEECQSVLTSEQQTREENLTLTDLDK